MYAILLVGEGAKDIFEVGYLQWCEAFLRKAKGKLMAQLLYDSGFVSGGRLVGNGLSHLLTLYVGFVARSGLDP